jgi:hypothetical protein
MGKQKEKCKCGQFIGKQPLRYDGYITEMKRLSSQSVSTGALMNMRLEDIIDLADWVDNKVATDFGEMKFRKVRYIYRAYNSGPFSIQFFLGYSLDGGAFVKTSALDATKLGIMNTAYSLKPFTIVPLTKELTANCIGSNLWTQSGSIDLIQYIHKLVLSNLEETDKYMDVNLLVLTSQDQLNTTNIGHWIENEYREIAKVKTAKDLITH